GRVRDAVTEDDRVRRGRRRELDEPAGALQCHRLAEGRLSRQCPVVGGGADDGAVGGGVLRLHLDVGQRRADAAGRGRPRPAVRPAAEAGDDQWGGGDQGAEAASPSRIPDERKHSLLTFAEAMTAGSPADPPVVPARAAMEPVTSKAARIARRRLDGRYLADSTVAGGPGGGDAAVGH